MLIDKADADDSEDYEEESSNYDDDDADHGSGDDDETFGWLLVASWSHGGGKSVDTEASSPLEASSILMIMIMIMEIWGWQIMFFAITGVLTPYARHEWSYISIVC